MEIKQVNRVTIPCLFLVSLHCEPVVDFTTQHHPFDFDRLVFSCLCPLVNFPVVDGYKNVKLVASAVHISSPTHTSMH